MGLKSNGGREERFAGEQPGAEVKLGTVEQKCRGMIFTKHERRKNKRGERRKVTVSCCLGRKLYCLGALKVLPVLLSKLPKLYN